MTRKRKDGHLPQPEKIEPPKKPTPPAPAGQAGIQAAKQSKTVDGKPKQGRAAHLSKWQFTKGKSGNPNGRPKGPTLTTVLKQMLEKVYTYKDPETGKVVRDKAGRTNRDIIVGATIALASKGHPQALKEVWNRIDGRVPLALQNPDGSNVFEPLGDVKAEKVASAVLSFIKARKKGKRDAK